MALFVYEKKKRLKIVKIHFYQVHLKIDKDIIERMG